MHQITRCCTAAAARAGPRQPCHIRSFHPGLVRSAARRKHVLRSSIGVPAAGRCTLLQPDENINPLTLACSSRPRQQHARRLYMHPAAAADPVASTTSVSSIDPPHSSSSNQFLSQQQLLDLGATFVRCWFAGIAKGPQAVQEPLTRILDSDVAIMADRVRLFNDTQGLMEVLAELERAHLEYHRSEHRPMLYAASEDAQRVYALVEGRYQDVGALPGHPATFRISKVHHILVLQVSGGRVDKLWLRRQLTEEDKDELLHDPLACYPAPFPRDSLRLADAATHEVAAERMVKAVNSWWQSWSHGGAASSSSNTANASSSSSSSSNDETEPPPVAATISSSTGSSNSNRSSNATGRALHDKPKPAFSVAYPAQLLAPNFKLWDAYGLWPSMRAQGRRYLTKEAALHYLQHLRYGYTVDLQVVDVAVAEGSLACFTHWQAKLTPKWKAAPEVAAAAVLRTQQQQPDSAPSGSSSSAAADDDGSFVVDGLEVDVFNEQLQLQDVWMFRGPIGPKETHLFLEYDRQQAAAEAAQAASSQEDVRQARRAQREQQLTELLTWMNTYQQQWSDYVKHVQKALERQQQLAKQQIMQQAYVVDQLQQHYKELQQQQKVLQQQQKQQEEQQQQQEEQQQEKQARAGSPAAVNVQQSPQQQEAGADSMQP